MLQVTSRKTALRLSTRSASGPRNELERAAKDVFRFLSLHETGNPQRHTGPSPFKAGPNRIEIQGPLLKVSAGSISRLPITTL